MANIKSAKKRIKVITKKTLRNKMIKSQTKTAIKKVLVAVNAGDKETATATLKGRPTPGCPLCCCRPHGQ